jgi:hypothetical protein
MCSNWLLSISASVASPNACPTHAVDHLLVRIAISLRFAERLDASQIADDVLRLTKVDFFCVLLAPA